MLQTIDPIYIKAITAKEWTFMQRGAKYNLPKHISKAYFGKSHRTNHISSQLYRRICLIIAYSIHEHDNNTEYLKQLLVDIFNHIKQYSIQYAKDNAGTIMCEVHKYVKLYLECNFHPENIEGEP